MEYQTPSMFDESGFNILSPTVQMMRAEGTNPSAQSSFRYNGDNPQQTAMMNNMNYQNQYAGSFGINPPPGFTPMYQQPNYGGFGYQNPYYNIGGGVAYSYTPRQYDPYPNAFQQQMEMEGRKAKEILQSAMNPPQETQYIDTGYTGYDAWGRPITQSDIKERNAPIYNNLYNSGAMSLSEYCSFNNGGISYIGVDGRTVRVGFGDNWYAGYDRIQQQKMIQQEQQKMYEEHMNAWNICRNINAKFLKDEGREEEAAFVQMEQSVEFQNKLNKLHEYHYKILQFDSMYDNMCAYMNTWQRSDKLGSKYVSPVKEQYVDHWNKLYERRTKQYPEHYGVDEFFNQGIMECQIIDDMAYDAELRAKRVDTLFDQQRCRELFGNMFPTYDPVSGTSCAPVSMNVSDIEITLPEHLKRDRYIQKRQAFENTIFGDNRLNVQQHYGPGVMYYG